MLVRVPPGCSSNFAKAEAFELGKPLGSGNVNGAAPPIATSAEAKATASSTIRKFAIQIL